MVCPGAYSFSFKGCAQTIGKYSYNLHYVNQVFRCPSPTLSFYVWGVKIRTFRGCIWVPMIRLIYLQLFRWLYPCGAFPGFPSMPDPSGWVGVGRCDSVFPLRPAPPFHYNSSSPYNLYSFP